MRHTVLKVKFKIWNKIRELLETALWMLSRGVNRDPIRVNT